MNQNRLIRVMVFLTMTLAGFCMFLSFLDEPQFPLPVFHISVTVNGQSIEQEGNSSLLINPNTASLEELDSLPGIGSVLAQRIIEYREEYPISVPEDLLEVKGIGEKTLENIRPYLIFSE